MTSNRNYPNWCMEEKKKSEKKIVLKNPEYQNSVGEHQGV